RQFRHWHGTLLAGFEQAAQDFFAIELFAASVALDHHVGNLVGAFVGSEPASTLQALSAAAHNLAFPAFARIDHAILAMAAKWARHDGGPPAEGSMCLRLPHCMPSWNASASPTGTIETKLTSHSTRAIPLAASRLRP